MQVALEQARRALACGEVPVGCAFVMPSGDVLCAAHNETNATKNATRHAELVALDRCADGLERVRECTLFVTVEPCIMCTGALNRVGVRRVVFGCSNPRFGGCGGVVDVNTPAFGERAFVAEGGVCADEAVQLLREFYEQGNPSAPNPARPDAVAAASERAHS